ncbi:MAG: glycosyltransferase, partial [Methylocystis sp.]
LGLEERIELPGWVGPEEARRLLAEADILVLPSRDENLPMSVIEGMANGLAVVTTPVGAIEDIIIPEETGLLVPPGDARALAGALQRLILAPDLRAKLGSSARAFHAQHLEISAYYRRLLEIWREVGGRAEG